MKALRVFHRYSDIPWDIFDEFVAWWPEGNRWTLDLAFTGRGVEE